MGVPPSAAVFGSVGRAECLVAQIRNDLHRLQFTSWSPQYPFSAKHDKLMDEDSKSPPIHADSPVMASMPVSDESIQTELNDDPDAQNMVISSLRSQIQDLVSQVTQLNAKLVKSYDRVSDLEDDLHVASSSLRTSTLKVSELELERTQHLAALNTGLLVEKSHVTAELTRLMEKATEEAAQRGQAETARRAIEKDLDDLSANLFQQANTMVAEARFERALSERKVEEAEAALKVAEEAVRDMQQQMQVLESQKEDAERSANNMRTLMGKGKWVDRTSEIVVGSAKPLKLLSSHLPYQEFLLFVAHLRSIHPSSPQAPAISTLLPLPFLARLVVEDSEPTLRLDVAPSLNWLSRRSVLAAIHSGQLTIEPVSAAGFQESLTSSSSSPMLSGPNSNIHASCALCGTSVLPAASDRPSLRSMSRTSSNGATGAQSWSAALFKNPLALPQSAYDSPPPTPPRSNSRSSTPQPPPATKQIHIFRVSPSTSPTTTLGISLPSSLPGQISHSTQNPALGQPPNRGSVSSTVYPLCTSGWCLSRLRTTCTLWAFVRTSIVEKIWEEEVPVLPPPPHRDTEARTGAPPPLPPRRRGLWGMASAISEKAASWSEGDKGSRERDKKYPVLPVAAPPLYPPGPKSASASSATPPPLPKRADARVPKTKSLPQNVPASDLPQLSRANSVKITRDKVQDNLTVTEPSTKQDKTTESSAPDARIIQKPSSALGPSTASATDGEGSAAAEQATGVSLPETSSAPSNNKSEVPADESKEEPDPHTIPLPESSPSTPMASGFTQDSMQPPSVSPGTAKSAGATGPGGESAAVATPTPPPLPRRAAARAARPASRPTSIVLEGAGAVADGGNDGRVAPVVVVPAPDAAQVDEAKSKEEVQEKEKRVEPNETQGTAKDVESASIQDGSAISVYSQNTITESEISMPNGVVKSPTKVDGLPSINGDEREARGHREIYIGEATWEERTWKELVRLKEDMFLARIGALR